MIFKTSDIIHDQVTYIEDLKTALSPKGLVITEVTHNYIILMMADDNGTIVELRSTTEFTDQNKADIRSHFSNYTEIG